MLGCSGLDDCDFGAVDSKTVLDVFDSEVEVDGAGPGERYLRARMRGFGLGCLPDPRRIARDPAFWKRYELCSCVGCFFDDGTSLLDGVIEVEPHGLMLRNRNADGVGFAVHIVDGDV